MAEYADNDLLDDFIRGEQRAYKEIYRRYYPKLYVNCYRIIRYKGNQDDVKDIVSVSLNKLFFRHAGFRSLVSMNAFVYQVARNGCIDFLRSKSRSMEKPHDPANLHALNDELDGDLLERILQEERVLQLVKELPKRSKEVIELFYLQGMKQKEIGILLNISPRSVENQLRFALDRLRNVLIDKRLVGILVIFSAALAGIGLAMFFFLHIFYIS